MTIRSTRNLFRWAPKFPVNFSLAIRRGHSNLKTVVISGVPRSGKSLLAQAIYGSTKCSVMHLDMLCGCARKAFSVPFSDHEDPNNIFGVTDDFQDFLIRVVKNVGHEFEYVRVFESTFFEPKEVADKFIASEYICVFS